MRRTWVKLYVDQVLRGSIFTELEPDERFIWFGFLCLAGDSPIEGKIGATVTFGYNDDQLSDLLKCDISLIKKSKRKFLRHDKIAIDDQEIISIVNWKKYQSEYGRQKKYRDESYKIKLQDKVTGISISPSISYEDYLSFLNNKNLKWGGITEEDKWAWGAAYPACDTEIELLRMIEWIKANPERGRKSNYRRFIVNWFARQQDKGGTRNQSPSYGRQEFKRDEGCRYIKPTPAEEEAEKKLLAEYQVAQDKFMRAKGYKTEGDIPFDEYETFTDFKTRIKRERR